MRYTYEELKALGPGKTDWEHLRNLTDEENEAAIASDPDSDFQIDENTVWEIVIPVRKAALSIRLDEDVLEFFKGSGPRYQTRINQVLRTYMKHQLGKK